MSGAPNSVPAHLRRRNLALALVLLAFVALTFLVSVAKMGGFR